MIIRFIFNTLFVLLLVSCGKESPVEVLTPQTIKYNVTFTSGSGGSVTIPGGSYDSGTSVSVTATPNSEYVFVNWSNGSTQNPLSVTVTSNQSITANFEKRKYPHPRSPEALEIQAKRWGISIGVDYAEAFCIVRTII